MGPKLTRLIERVRWIKKTIIPTVVGGVAAGGFQPVETGLPPFWNALANGLVAGGAMFMTIYLPKNGPEPL